MITKEMQKCRKGHLTPSNLTFLLIAIDRNGFRRTKEEGQTYKSTHFNQASLKLFHLSTSAFPPIFFSLVVHVHVLFLPAISPLHIPSCYIHSTPLPVLALPCNPYKCHKFCLSLLFSPEEAKLVKRRQKKKLPKNLQPDFVVMRAVASGARSRFCR